jgi:hypothetical protein
MRRRKFITLVGATRSFQNNASGSTTSAETFRCLKMPIASGTVLRLCASPDSSWQSLSLPI